MTDFERRALLGDRKAQEECTMQGIVLPCPRCGKGGASTKYVLGDYWYECPHCQSASGFHSSAEVALSDWNTRPAPPIGRCKGCANWYKQHCASGPCATEPTNADFFCGNFEPKSQLKELATLQPLGGVGTKEKAKENHVPGTAPERRSNEH